MEIFGIDGVVLEGQEVDRANRLRRYYLKVKKHQEHCCRCGELNEGTLKRYGTRTHHYRDIPSRNERILLVVEFQRFLCSKCKKAFVQRIDGFDPSRSMTTRCLEWIRNSCLGSTFDSVANACGCSARTVRDIAYEYIAARNRIYKPYMPKWLGIDEITLDGTINNYCCVLVDIAQRKPIDVLPNRRLRTIKRWLATVGDGDKLMGVSMDMYENFRTAVREVFPKAPIAIVIDRFHVLQWANEAVDRVRRRVSKKSPDVKKTKVWKRNVNLLHKRWGNIPSHKKPDFLKWLKEWPDLEEVYIHKEIFCQIYQFAEKDAARKALEEWEVSIPEELRSTFKEVFTAITEWREEFLAFIDWRETNAYTEAFNSVIRNVNNRGRGYSFQVLRGKLLFATENDSDTFRIERRPESIKKHFREAQRTGNTAPKVCMECGRDFDQEDPADVLSGRSLPDGGVWCSSCNRPFKADWRNNSKSIEWAGRRRRIPCDGCGRTYYNKMTSLDSGLLILCKNCLKDEEEVRIRNREFAARVAAVKEYLPTRAEFASLKAELEDGRAALEGRIPATNSIPTEYLRPNYEAMYQSLERMRSADESKAPPNTKRASGYPIIAKDLKRILRGRPPSDPATRSKRRERKDEDTQSSLDLVFEDLKIKFKRRNPPKPLMKEQPKEVPAPDQHTLFNPDSQVSENAPDISVKSSS